MRGILARHNRVMCILTPPSRDLVSRRPQGTPVLEHVREHLFAFLDGPSGDTVPRFCVCELERYLRCGDMRYGHATLVCRRCDFEHDIAFSCKRRGFCTYCLHRRMVEQSEFIQSHVIGETPVRHWVLSLPPPLRNLLGFDGPLTSRVLKAFADAITRHYLVKARKATNSREFVILGPGIVTAIHRASSLLFPALHFHSIVTAGVFVLNRETDVVSFLDLLAPTPAEISDVAWDTLRRAVRMFRRKKMWKDLAEPGVPQRVLSGEIQLGSCVRPVRFNASASRQHMPAPALAGVGTFDVWVGQHIRRGENGRLRALLQYVLAPPFRDHQFVREDDGRITFRLKRARRDGTDTRTFDPIEFLEALVGLIPAPHSRLIRMHGMYARRAKHRDQVVAQPPIEPEVPAETDEPDEDRLAWAELLHRAYEMDVQRCPRCQARLLLIMLESDRLIYRRARDRAPPGRGFLDDAA